MDFKKKFILDKSFELINRLLVEIGWFCGHKKKRNLYCLFRTQERVAHAVLMVLSFGSLMVVQGGWVLNEK